MQRFFDQCALWRSTAATTMVLLTLTTGRASTTIDVSAADGDRPDSTATQVVTEVQVLTPTARAAVTAGPRGGVLDFDFLPVGVPEEGDAPGGIAFSSDGTLIAIAHRDSQNVVVFDASTRNVLRTIPVSGSPNALAVTGTTAVTANIFEDTASIIDLVAGTEDFVVDVNDQPGAVAITPDGTKALVGNTVDSNISVIDIATGTVDRDLGPVGFWQTTSFGAWAGGFSFTSIEITPDGQTVVFPDRFANQVKFIDIATGVLTAVPTADQPVTLDISADGTLAAVAHNFPESRVTTMNVLGPNVINTFLTGAGATSIPSIAISGDGAKAAIEVSNAVRIMNLTTGATTPNLSTSGVGGLETTPDGQFVVVNNFIGSIISFASESIVANTLSTTIPDMLAVSPTGDRAATAHLLRKESMEVIGLNGAASVQEADEPTGPRPEGDKARNVAVTADGSLAVVINNHSRNATVLDLNTNTFVAAYDTGDRPGAVALTPDGTKAVVANLDSFFCTVIDLVAETATNVPMGRRGSQVEISPDGMFAYIPVVASGDGVFRINLNTLAQDGPKILTGNMGGVGYLLDMASGMTLSHDGATLAVCGSFTDDISFIDTASWTEVARVGVGAGALPTRATFSPDDSTLYVSNRNNDTVSVLSNAGVASALLDTINVGDFPFVSDTTSDGTRLYVANYLDKSVSVIDTGTNNVITTIPLPQTSTSGNPAGVQAAAAAPEVYVAATGGDLHVIDTTTNTIARTINFAAGAQPAQLVYNAARNTALIPSPGGGDGLFVVSLGLPGDMNCDGVVSVGDINPFVLALTDPAAYAAQFPDCRLLNGDCSGDGQVSVGDINCFVALVTGS